MVCCGWGFDNDGAGGADDDRIGDGDEGGGHDRGKLPTKRSDVKFSKKKKNRMAMQASQTAKCLCLEMCVSVLREKNQIEYKTQRLVGVKTRMVGVCVGDVSELMPQSSAKNRITGRQSLPTFAEPARQDKPTRTQTTQTKKETGEKNTRT